LRSPLSLAAVAALGLLALLAPGTAAAGHSKQVAKQAQNASLGRSVLTNLQGRTLYTLSAEQNGKFICTGGCLSTWRPLLIAAGTKPRGPVALGTVKRPEGKTQVTYKGRPLYSFSGDTKAGDANGEGIKDAGTWHAATTSKPAPAPEPQPYPEQPYPY
jgi:predicted lipoprotein with Yx(FWY)xxD motif